MTTIIGFAGRKGHGKDTAASILIQDYGFQPVKFATGIKRIATVFFHDLFTKEGEVLTDSQLWDLTDGPLKETTLEVLLLKGNNAFRQFMEEQADLLIEVLGVDIRPLDVPEFKGATSREFQQFLGTEVGRNLVGDLVWTDAGIRDASQYDRAAITDARFPNEVDAIHEAGGVVFRVKRENVEDTGFSNHPSEALIDTLDVDEDLPNNGTIEELHALVLDAAADHGIL